MSIRPGVMVGGYEVLRALSAGGNAAVYVGYDPALRREVALKILSGPQAHDPSQLERLRQEARVLAQLAHPNILQVIDLELFDDQPVLVTELLEGQTLRARLTAGPLPALQALEVAMQVASALAAAHRQGVVHRDVKPENLFVTRDGHCKVLDFGLAKPLASGETSRLGEALQTTGGLLQGTVGYLSPEQIGGQPVDARADVYALGLVIHELVTGKPPGRGATAIERQISLLRDGPQPLPREAGAPAGLDEVVARCLEVEPPDRFADAGQLLEALEEVRAGQGSSRGPRRWTFRRRWPVVAAALLAGLLGLGAGAWLVSRPSPIPTFQRLTFQRGNVLRARFGPGGRSVVLGAAWDDRPAELFRIDLDNGEARPLGIVGADVLAVSRSGELAVLLKDRYLRTTLGAGTLARVRPGQGSPRTVLEDVSGADWDPSGQELAVTRRLPGGAHVLEYPPGHQLFQGAGPLACPRFSPDGRRIAFMGSAPAFTIYVIDAAGGEVRTLLAGIQASDPFLAWLPSGDEVVVAGNTSFDWMPPVLAVGMDGRVRPLARYPMRTLLHDVAPDGHLLLEREFFRSELRVSGPGPGPDRDLSWLDGSRVAALDSVRGLLLLDESFEAVAARPQLFVRPLGGGPAVLLGEGTAQDLSEDGAWAAAIAPNRSEGLRLFPTGPGVRRDLALPGFLPVEARFRHGHGELLVLAHRADGALRLLRLPLAGGAPLQVVDREVTAFAASPDGRTVATADAGGRLALLPLDGGAERALGKLEPGEQPVGWTADGRGLLLVDPGALQVRLVRLDLASAVRSSYRVLTPPDPAGVIRIDKVRVDDAAALVGYSFIRVTMSDLVLADPPR
jgi:tRNA A-37 threonylcarbamoyl transferase component Bud32